MQDSDESGIAAEDGDERSGNVLDYFRDQPARFFVLLGTIVFIGGWAGIIYVVAFSDVQTAFDTFFRIQLLVSLGASVTLTSGLLWGIAAYIWIHLLPEGPDPG